MRLLSSGFFGAFAVVVCVGLYTTASGRPGLSADTSSLTLTHRAARTLTSGGSSGGNQHAGCQTTTQRHSELGDEHEHEEEGGHQGATGNDSDLKPSDCDVVDFLSLFETGDEETPTEMIFHELGLEDENATEADVERLLSVLTSSGGGAGHSEGPGHHDDQDHGDEHGDEKDDHVDEEEDHKETDHGAEDNGMDSSQHFRLTAHQLIEEFGVDERLTQEGLEDSCMAILACQVDGRCELGEVEEGNRDGHDDEDDLLVLKIVVAIIFFAEAMLGALVPGLAEFLSMDIEWWLSLLNSFSAGIILATGMIHLVPEIMEEEAEVDGLGDYPLGMLLLVVGFLSVFLIEQVFFPHEHALPTRSQQESFRMKACSFLNRRPARLQIPTDSADLGEGVLKTGKLAMSGSPRPSELSTPRKGVLAAMGSVKDALLLLLAFSAHGILEGVIVGFQDDRTDFWALFASVASHKLPAAIAVTTRFIQNDASFGTSLLGVFMFAIIAPAGVFVGLAADNVPPLVSVIIQGLAAGTFVYIGAYEILHQEFDGHQSHRGDGEKSERPRVSKTQSLLVKYGAMLLGVAVLAGLASLPHSHGHGDHDHGHN